MYVKEAVSKLFIFKKRFLQPNPTQISPSHIQPHQWSLHCICGKDTVRKVSSGYVNFCSLWENSPLSQSISLDLCLLTAGVSLRCVVAGVRKMNDIDTASFSAPYPFQDNLCPSPTLPRSILSVISPALPLVAAGGMLSVPLETILQQQTFVPPS